jgi:hypothetical protein
MCGCPGQPIFAFVIKIASEQFTAVLQNLCTISRKITAGKITASLENLNLRQQQVSCQEKKNASFY